LPKSARVPVTNKSLRITTTETIFFDICHNLIDIVVQQTLIGKD
jgi:hypothetical protein